MAATVEQLSPARRHFAQRHDRIIRGLVERGEISQPEAGALFDRVILPVAEALEEDEAARVLQRSLPADASNQDRVTRFGYVSALRDASVFVQPARNSSAALDMLYYIPVRDAQQRQQFERHDTVIRSLLARGEIQPAEAYELRYRVINPLIGSPRNAADFERAIPNGRVTPDDWSRVSYLAALRDGDFLNDEVYRMSPVLAALRTFDSSATTNSRLAPTLQGPIDRLMEATLRFEDVLVLARQRAQQDNLPATLSLRALDEQGIFAHQIETYRRLITNTGETLLKSSQYADLQERAKDNPHSQSGRVVDVVGRILDVAYNFDPDQPIAPELKRTTQRIEEMAAVALRNGPLSDHLLGAQTRLAEQQKEQLENHAAQHCATTAFDRWTKARQEIDRNTRMVELARDPADRRLWSAALENARQRAVNLARMITDVPKRLYNKIAKLKDRDQRWRDSQRRLADDATGPRFTDTETERAALAALGPAKLGAAGRPATAVKTAVADRGTSPEWRIAFDTHTKTYADNVERVAALMAGMTFLARGQQRLAALAHQAHQAQKKDFFENPPPEARAIVNDMVKLQTVMRVQATALTQNRDFRNEFLGPENARTAEGLAGADRDQFEYNNGRPLWTAAVTLRAGESLVNTDLENVYRSQVAYEAQHTLEALSFDVMRSEKLAAGLLNNQDPDIAALGRRMATESAPAQALTDFATWQEKDAALDKANRAYEAVSAKPNSPDAILALDERNELLHEQVNRSAKLLDLNPVAKLAVENAINRLDEKAASGKPALDEIRTLAAMKPTIDEEIARYRAADSAAAAVPDDTKRQAQNVLVRDVLRKIALGDRWDPDTHAHEGNRARLVNGPSEDERRRLSRADAQRIVQSTGQAVTSLAMAMHQVHHSA